MQSSNMHAKRLKLYDAPRGSPYALRIFMLERQWLHLEVQIIDTVSLRNRFDPAYLKINPRGTVPALVINDDIVLTEIWAIAEYLDELATQSEAEPDTSDRPKIGSLFGTTPEERGVTRMWSRRIDSEIVQPVIDWWRDSSETLDIFLGHRIPCPEARHVSKLRINQALNQLEMDMQGRDWLAGAKLTVADCICFGLLKRMVDTGGAGWILHEARRNIVGWYRRMEGRESVTKALECFKEGRLAL